MTLQIQLKDIAFKAGEIILQHQKEGFDVDFKSDDSPVTNADKAADLYIRKSLAELFPDDQCISEEALETPNQNKNIWYIDPLDGTKDFVAGNGKFSVIIGRCNSTTGAEFGLIYFPLTRELFMSSDKGVIYSLDGEESLLEFSFGQITLFKKSALLYESTKKILSQIEEKKKRATRPSGYAIKDLLISKAKNLILGHGYIYELCACDALVKSVGGSLSDSKGKSINYYQPNMKVANGCFFGEEKGTTGSKK